ncbi:glycoside hydrolase family 5 protein [Zasmidium cellare ATCC 36951]|uniref:Glycoside hydrolase family 5 protein n=1 Tax=Zasmidium cellare ATCC 36951 TaxID=1080233 RepID=A0A6A6CWA6_ZASCE|nr:glycoside hydrolase family 5 protein [Zasmidium cellare ATCC 36951]KAF2170079.1 glycoside hydrolase family 5 protein [Zasmidium cellare ATCC 36951]
MRLNSAIVALCAAASTSAAPNFVRGASGFNWGNVKIRGINLGGWLVLEPWITPSIFQNLPQDLKIVDEYTLGQALGEKAYDQVYKNHWETWVTWEDIKKIADSGFNVIRIPIGYWAYDNSDSPYVKGAAPFIDAAIDWARSVGLKVIIDLHGAPGSQNCFDNSGQKCDKPQWTTGDTTKKTLDVLQTIQNKYGASSYDDVIAGIELLNEPLTPELDLDTVKQFTRDGYGQQRTVSQSRVVVFQDGFQNTSAYNNFLTPSDNNAQYVAVDHHEYQVFTPELVSMQPWQHRQYVCNNAFVYNGGDKWTFVGEWSAAMTDCAPALNGYGIGARYDGTYPGSWYVGSCQNINFIETWDQQLKDDTRGYIEAQMETFERYTEGWFFWNFKAEQAPEWNAFALIDAGVFPQPLTDRKFGSICS